MYIVIAGDPVSGFSFFGPFDSVDEAVEWACMESIDNWWTAELTLSVDREDILEPSEVS